MRAIPSLSHDHHSPTRRFSLPFPRVPRPVHHALQRPVDVRLQRHRPRPALRLRRGRDPVVPQLLRGASKITLRDRDHSDRLCSYSIRPRLKNDLGGVLIALRGVCVVLLCFVYRYNRTSAPSTRCASWPAWPRARPSSSSAATRSRTRGGRTPRCRPSEREPDRRTPLSRHTQALSLLKFLLQICSMSRSLFSFFPFFFGCVVVFCGQGLLGQPARGRPRHRAAHA